MTPPISDDRIGQVLGARYCLIAPLGTGASASVYLADDTTLRRRVAVKVLHAALANDENFFRRFQAEAQAAAALNHPHVMAVYDWGNQNIPYLVTEYLGGGSLRSVMDAQRLTVSQALVVGLEAVRGLEYAHRRGFVHRDIKPANLLFDEDGRLRIADFGLARALAESGWTEPVGSVMGTAKYASPEQARGEKLDGKSDIYSLALVLIEAVTGSIPFMSDTTIGTLMARIRLPLVVPPEMGPLVGLLEQVAVMDPLLRPNATEFGVGLLAAAQHLPRPEPFVLPGATTEFADSFVDRTMHDSAGGILPSSQSVAPIEQDTIVVPFSLDEMLSTDGDQNSSDEDGVNEDVVVDEENFQDGNESKQTGTSDGMSSHDEDQINSVIGGIVPRKNSSPMLFDAASDPELAESLWADGPLRSKSPGMTQRNVPVGFVDDPEQTMLLAHGVPQVQVGNQLQQELDQTIPSGLTTAIPASRHDDTKPIQNTQSPQNDDEIHDYDSYEAIDTHDVKKKRRWPWLLLLLFVLAGIAIGGFFLLKPKKAPVFPMPSVVNTSIEEARLQLEPLEIAITQVDERKDDTKVGQVLSQDPEPEVLVEKGSPVVLHVSLGPTLVNAPTDLAGKSTKDATQAVESQGLVVELGEKKYSETTKSDVVLSSSIDPSVTPTPDGQIPKGSKVIMIVSQGPEPRTIPSGLVGKTYEDSVAQLEKLGLLAAKEEDYSETVAKGVVLSVRPGAGEKAARGSTVTLVVSKGPPTVVIPNVVGLSVSDAVTKLSSVGISVSGTRGSPTSKVTGTDPAVGLTVRKGSSVVLITQ